MAKFRAALSYENELRGPVPKEPSPGIWVYEIEASGEEAALSQAEQQWQEEQHIRPGDGSPTYCVVARL
jgi:hypothetical protein